jgi:hypothetical protein
MRCQCCNKNLNDYESTRKHSITGQYLDTCNNCLSEINSIHGEIPCTVRHDLAQYEDINDDDDVNTLNVFTNNDNTYME